MTGYSAVYNSWWVLRRGLKGKKAERFSSEEKPIALQFIWIAVHR